MDQRDSVVRGELGLLQRTVCRSCLPKYSHVRQACGAPQLVWAVWLMLVAGLGHANVFAGIRYAIFRGATELIAVREHQLPGLPPRNTSDRAACR